MAKLVVTQINWNGRGDNRDFGSTVTDDALPRRLERLAGSYTFTEGRIRITLDGKDITDQVAALKVV